MALAFDAATSADAGGAASSLTFSHTCTGDNRILFVWVYLYHNGTGASGDLVTGVTYAGQAMTQIDKAPTPGGTYTRYTYLYYIIAPATGANNVVVSCSAGTERPLAWSSSYTGAQQTGQPDNKTSGGNGTASAASLATALTTVADNCWMISGCASPLVATTASTNVTARGGSQFTGTSLGDNNGAITPAASYSMTWAGGTSPYIVLQASFSPVVVATGAPWEMLLTGVAR